MYPHIQSMYTYIIGTHIHKASEKYFKRCRAKYSQVSITAYVSTVLWDIFSERLNTWQRMSYRDSSGRDQAKHWSSLLPASIISASSAGLWAQDSFPSPQVAAQTTGVFRISFLSSEVFPPSKDSRTFPYYLSLRNIFNSLNLDSHHFSYTGPFNWFLSSSEFDETEALICAECPRVRTTLIMSISTFLTFR